MAFALYFLLLGLVLLFNDEQDKKIKKLTKRIEELELETYGFVLDDEE